MPSTTVQHEPWCQEHQNDGDGHSCTAPPGGIQFGPMRPASRQFPAHPIGDAFAFQGEDDPGPRVTVDYGGTALDA